MSDDHPKLDLRHTALVLIDLQKGIGAYAGDPYTGAEVFARSGQLAARFRGRGDPVVLVRVGRSANFGDALKQPVDQPTAERRLPDNWMEYADELAASARDVYIIKRQ